MKFVSREEWKEAFGETEAEALALFSKTYPIVLELDGEILLSIDLAAFSEVLELFDDDPALVDRSIELYPLFRDTSISPDWLMASWTSSRTGSATRPSTPPATSPCSTRISGSTTASRTIGIWQSGAPPFGRFCEWMAWTANGRITIQESIFLVRAAS
jgi:hypothetical protein